MSAICKCCDRAQDDEETLVRMAWLELAVIRLRQALRDAGVPSHLIQKIERGEET